MSNIISFEDRKERAAQNVRIRKFEQRFCVKPVVRRGRKVGYRSATSLLRDFKHTQMLQREQLVVDHARMTGLIPSE